MSLAYLYQSHSDVELLSTLILDVDREWNALSDGEAASRRRHANRQRPGLEASRAEHHLLRALALFLHTTTHHALLPLPEKRERRFILHDTTIQL